MPKYWPATGPQGRTPTGCTLTQKTSLSICLCIPASQYQSEPGHGCPPWLLTSSKTTKKAEGEQCCHLSRGHLEKQAGLCAHMTAVLVLAEQHTSPSWVTWGKWLSLGSAPGHSIPFTCCYILFLPSLCLVAFDLPLGSPMSNLWSDWPTLIGHQRPAALFYSAQSFLCLSYKWSSLLVGMKQNTIKQHFH